jgi:CPA2 family monovalent cation:H+ antiporter-2
MSEHVDFVVLQQILVVLGAVSIVVPLFHRLRLSPVIGFLLIGMLLGPSALGALVQRIPDLHWVVLSDRERIASVAEFGVVFLMFMIGLELSFERLMLMRRLVFGLGPLQLLLSAAAIAAVTAALGQSREDAIVIGLALALSSTAVVLQVLADEKRAATATGRTSFAILLFQDIAVVPILFAVTIMGSVSGASNRAPDLGAFALSLGQAALAVTVIIAAGRLMLRPLFRSVARTQSPELFMAAGLLVLLGAATATAAAGLSMAMGALLAGLLLAETEYRRQIEALIDPFKGLLLGVFLISMGMTLDLSRVAAAPFLIGGLAFGLIGIKALLTYAAARLFRVTAQNAVQTGLLLGPGGEFSFVVLGAGRALGLLQGRASDIALIVAALTMAGTPFLSLLGKTVTRRLDPKRAVEPSLFAPMALAQAARVIVVGYGRVGRVVAEMLQKHEVDFIAVDTDVDVVAQARNEGAPVYYGDAGNPLLLEHCGLANARALVVTMDSAAEAEEVVSAARRTRADLPIVSRARDADHAGRLYQKGATDAVPETIEASLLLSETVLADIGVPMGYVIASIHERRAQFRSEIQALAPSADIRARPRRRLTEDNIVHKSETPDEGTPPT